MKFIPDCLRVISIQSVILRFALAIICSGIIGLNRGKKHHAAGLRTHLLVCVGAASVMMINQYLYDELGYSVDVGRMGAQVISGIGFLGAGTILVTGKKHIKGLTSAAGLWASACMGLAAGIGFYEAAIIMCILLFVILGILERLDEKYVKTSADLTVYIEYDATIRFSRIISCIREIGWHINEIEQLKNSVEGVNALILILEVQDRTADHDESLKLIDSINGVLFVEEI